MSALALLLFAQVTTAPATTTEAFALVIGQNADEPGGAGQLHFADDDAVAMARLFGEARLHTRLLVELDVDTERLVEPVDARRPTRAAFEAAVTALFADIERANAAGARTELILFYSGHGNVAGGEGYVALADGRLTRGELHRVLLASPAAVNHVIVDACRSYYLAFEKGPGGHRSPHAGAFAGDGHAPVNAGFILSTSSDEESHEWTRYQGGVFSHEIRSALRGAADVDGDHQVSYAELGAFLERANAGIPNPRYRPDFAIVPPFGQRADLSRTVVRWPAEATRLELDGYPGTHAYLESRLGERLLDLHVRSGEVHAVYIPETRPLFLRFPKARTELPIEAAGGVSYPDLEARELEVAPKGAEHLAFEQLFSEPFGQAEVRRYVEGWALSIAVEPEVRTRWLGDVGLYSMLSGAALGLTGTLWALERRGVALDASQEDRVRLNGTIDRLNVVAIVGYALAAAGAGAWLFDRLSEDETVVIAPTPGGDVLVGISGRFH